MGGSSMGLWGQVRPQDSPKGEIESKHRAQWLQRGGRAWGAWGGAAVDTAGMLKAGEK